MVADAKNAFVGRYNPSHSDAVALASGLNASLRWNRLYAQGADRGRVRRQWRDELVRLAEAYGRPHPLGRFLEDVESLRASMNAAFPHKVFRQGFRVSHAQKSLAIYLKHLWCLGRVPAPPACPIDRAVLRLVAPDAIPPWTKVDSMDDHARMLEWAATVAQGAGMGLAEWEVVAFAA